MKLINIVKNLQEQGVEIKYRIRSDGGIIVTEVNEMKFSGASGNTFVRTISGEGLSEKQIKQRMSIRPPKKVSPKSRKKQDIPDFVKKQIQKLQRMYNKDEKQGKPTIRNYRFVREKYGEKEANRLLLQSEYYIKGIAYTENIDALIQRLNQIANIVRANDSDASPIDECIQSTIDERDHHRDDFTEDKLKYLLDLVYTFEQEWNAYSQGYDSDYSNEGQIISSFASNYLTTLRSRTARRKNK